MEPVERGTKRKRCSQPRYAASISGLSCQQLYCGLRYLDVHRFCRGEILIFSCNITNQNHLLTIGYLSFSNMNFFLCVWLCDWIGFFTILTIDLEFQAWLNRKGCEQKTLTLISNFYNINFNMQSLHSFYWLVLSELRIWSNTTGSTWSRSSVT